MNNLESWERFLSWNCTTVVDFYLSKLFIVPDFLGELATSLFTCWESSMLVIFSRVLGCVPQLILDWNRCTPLLPFRLRRYVWKFRLSSSISRLWICMKNLDLDRWGIHTNADNVYWASRDSPEGYCWAWYCFCSSSAVIGMACHRWRSASIDWHWECGPCDAAERVVWFSFGRNYPCTGRPQKLMPFRWETSVSWSWSSNYWVVDDVTRRRWLVPIYDVHI